MQKLFFVFLIVTLTIVIKLFPDDITRLIIFTISILTILVPIFTTKHEEITIKSKGEKTIFLWTYNILQTTDGKTFVNMNFFFPTKTNSNRLQTQLKIGKTYIVKTHRPWLFFRYRNILSIQLKTNKKKK